MIFLVSLVVVVRYGASVCVYVCVIMCVYIVADVPMWVDSSQS